MKFLKKIFQKLKNPNALTVAVSLILFAAGLTLSLMSVWGKMPSAVAYVSYALAAVTLTYFVYLLITGSKRMRSALKAFCLRHKATEKFVTDYSFRTFVIFVISCLINAAYAVYNGVYGIVFMSVWYGSLSLYYISLGLLRGGVALKTLRIRRAGLQENEQSRLKTYCITGVFLMLLPLALTAAVVQMALAGKSFEHAGMLIFVAAAYTFTKVIILIINIVKTRRTRDYILYSIRNIGVADALVSVLALQTAMFAAFSEGADFSWANGATGGVVCGITFLLGLYMIINSAVRLKKSKENTDGRQI